MSQKSFVRYIILGFVLPQIVFVLRHWYDVCTTGNRTVELLDRSESGARGARLDGAVLASYANRTRKVVCIAGLLGVSHDYEIYFMHI
jgi:hypothetical protein